LQKNFEFETSEYEKMYRLLGIAKYSDRIKLPAGLQGKFFGRISNYVENLGKKNYENLYVQSFDFSQNTNLYLTTHNRTDFGKQANELQEFKNLFLENGFDLNNELPDYLPAILAIATGCLATALNATGILGDFNYRETISPWFRSLLMLQPDMTLMENVPIIFKCHMLMWMATAIIFPFTRLVHCLSFPFEYFCRSNIIYRRK